MRVLIAFSERSSHGSWLLLFLFLVGVSSAHAASRPPETLPALTIEIGKGELLQGTKGAAGLFVADPDIADIEGSQENGYFIYGKAAGQTTLIGSDFEGQQLFRVNVTVIQNLDEVRHTLSQRFPDAHVSLKASRGSVMLTGTVPDNRIHLAILDSIRPILAPSQIVDELVETKSGVIRLSVRVIEVSRTRLDAYGVNWLSLLDTEPFLQLLLHDGVATIVNETTLTTVNGKEATFSAGEQIAIPQTSTTDGVTQSGVDFKPIGLSIRFRPALMPGDRLSLDVDSEISVPGGSSSSVNGNTFPNINSRSYKTSVQLVPAENFILSGFTNFQTNSDLQTPRDPNAFSRLIQNIFGHESITSRNDDFLIVVTPYFGDARQPLQTDPVGKPTTVLESILSQRRADKAPVTLYGNVGFSY